MKLSFQDYRDKVMGCWVGKNIGGVLGAPFEGLRQYNDVNFYTQDLSMGPPPNDDLDLQIIWLAAVERYGRQVNASILGDYWLSYVIPNWVEYGMGKANLRAGLQPPMSGSIDNVYQNSCGCFIRSEIWACLAPGMPELATKYAFEDAIVDHGQEGMYGEVFTAAIQSAAFVESDPQELIRIALSYIPENSKVAAAVQKAVECRAQGVPFRKAIGKIHDAAPGTFGVQSVTQAEAEKRSQEMGMSIVGEPGFDAAENIGYVIAGLLYGEDFGDQICKANACGEDTDCTAATLGGLLGIIHGAAKLPKKWTDPLGDKIATMCIDKTSRGIWVPDTATELADRILRVAPGFLGVKGCDLFAEGGYTIDCKEGKDLYCRNAGDYRYQMNGGGGKDHSLSIRELSLQTPYVIRREFPAFNMMIDLGGEPFFCQGEERTFHVEVKNAMEMCQQQWAKITLYAPDGVEAVGAKSFLLPLNNLWGSRASADFTIVSRTYDGARLEMLVDVMLEGRHSTGTAKVVLMRKPGCPASLPPAEA